MAGIYVHVPFCKVKCHYCDFHFSTNLSRKSKLVDAIVLEIQQKSSILNNEIIKTIYFGGGTPSLLSEYELKAILSSIESSYHVSENAEITLESNPDDLTNEKLVELKQAGINRLSIGVQSFEQKNLEYMNRAHNSKEARSSIELAKENGFENITIDLIYGLPSTSLDDWKKEIETFLSLGVPHLSAYCLTIEPQTYFGHLSKTNQLTLPTDEVSLSQFKYLIDTLSSNDFEHYEISNFAQPNYISQHNSAYWKNELYLGIGPSAHSYFENTRSWNVSNNAQYIKAIENGTDCSTSETLSINDRFNEYILTRLRTKWGLEEKDLKSISTVLWGRIQPELSHQITAGNIVKNDSVYTITEKGKFLCDNISANLFVD